MRREQSLSPQQSTLRSVRMDAGCRGSSRRSLRTRPTAGDHRNALPPSPSCPCHSATVQAHAHEASFCKSFDYRAETLTRSLSRGFVFLSRGSHHSNSQSFGGSVSRSHIRVLYVRVMSSGITTYPQILGTHFIHYSTVPVCFTASPPRFSIFRY